MRTAVDLARDQGWTVRAVGAAHSHSRVAAPDGLLVETDGWQGVIDSSGVTAGAEEPTATIRSGSRIYQLGDPLHRLGLALVNQGDIDKQSIAGATATGTHGTGPTLGNLSASVRAVRLVLADGSIVTCSADDEPELFSVARHSLGAVGLVTEVRLRVRERYRLHERQWIAPPDEVFSRIDQLTQATRHFEFFWVPDRDLCACKSLTEVSATEDPDAVAVDGDGGEIAPPIDVAKRERKGWSHQIISSIRDDKHTEMEYSVPAEHGPDCFDEVRSMIQQRFPDLAWPLEYRTLAADDLMISAAGGRETVTISVHQDISLDDRPLFEACEQIFRSYDGRPHWGKVHYQTGQELAQLYPAYRDWWAIRDRFDPDGVFVTKDLARLRP
jgi:FAD/FMN-containing dehydrogenase